MSKEQFRKTSSSAEAQSLTQVQTHERGRTGPEDDVERASTSAPSAIVGIATSAEGVPALQQLLANVPTESGIAWIVMVADSAALSQELPTLLQAHTTLPVHLVRQRLAMQANQLLVLPPGARIQTIDTHLRLTTRTLKHQSSAPSDSFFRALARCYRDRAIGVVLHGAGFDGVVGLRHIQHSGGLAIIEAKGYAELDEATSGTVVESPVDLVLPLEQIPGAIFGFIQTEPKLVVPKDGQKLDSRAQGLLQKVFAQIQARTGRDFTFYKRSTLLRRINRRMQFNHIQEPSTYLELLRKVPQEVHALADDLLINVTSFFRDQAVYDRLEKDVIPELCAKKEPNDTVRIWVAGCATGEEAYSLAMLLLEHTARLEKPLSIQIFASDLHPHSLEKAREGFYSGDIEVDVRPDRLEKFFHKENGGYRVRKELRELVIFAPHNILSDPPFARLDLISCRNLLIYLQRDLQQQVAELFHYALLQDGFLVLGSSESIDNVNLFRVEDKKCCIFRKRNVPGPEPRLPVFPVTRGRTAEGRLRNESGEPVAYAALHQRMVDHYGPPSVLVSPDDNVVHFSSRAGRYLVQPGGEPTTNLFKLIREELRLELRSALSLAREKCAPVRTSPIAMRIDGTSAPMVLDLHPALEADHDGFVLLTFEELQLSLEATSPQPDAQRNQGQSKTIRALEADKLLVEQRLQAIIEEYETSQEEIRASNEELQSANEELRSTLEELETNKEELQSMNEELQTLNQENRHKVEELAQLSSDLQNLLVATDIATLFLDRKLHILRFTPKIAEIFNVRMTDRGRPLSDFTHRLGYSELHRDAAQVLDRLVPLEREVKDEVGRWYLTRVLPYRSGDDRIAGVVVTFVEITQQKIAEEELRRAKEFLEHIIQALPEPLLILMPQNRIHSANAAFLEHFGLSADAIKGQKIYDVGDGEWNIPSLHVLLDEAMHENSSLSGVHIEHEFRTLGRRVMLFNARRVDDMQLTLLGVHDITERFEAEQALRESEKHSRLLALVANHSPDFIGVSNIEGVPLFVNRAGLNLLGLTEEQAHQALMPNLFIAEERRFIRDIVLPATLRDGRWAGELHMCTFHEQTVLPVLFTVFRVDDPATREPIAFATIIRDLTEQKRSEQALRVRESRYRALAELSPEAILVYADGRYVYANAAAATLLAAENPEDVLGRSPYDFLDYQYHEAVRERVQKVLEGQATITRIVYRWRRLDGSVADVEVVAGPIDWENRPAVQILARDVTERQRAEEQLQEANRHKDEYLAMLGHELRNPLAAICNAAEIMKAIDSDEPQLRRVYGVLHRQSSHMSRIINGLLDVSRIAQGKVHLEVEPIHAQEVLERVLHDNAFHATGRGLTLLQRAPEDPLWVMGDDVRLVQVFDNIVGNAIKFTHSPGTIEVTLERDGGEAVFRVRDSGVGIRREMLHRIFESFHQENQGIARTSGGLGLGLALAKGLVTLHGGTITAHSDGPDTGAEFVVRLPLTQPPTATPRERPKQPSVQRRVLIVEDNADAARMMRDLLQLVGHEVTILHRGHAALSHLRSHGADVVLCDLGLPEMTGHELARAVRKEPGLASIPLIALTGYGQPEDRKLTREAGFDDHIVKPVDLESLNEVLERFSAGRGELG